MRRFIVILFALLAALPAQARTITITDAPYNASISAPDNSAAIQSAINALLGDITLSNPPGRGGTIVVPADGCYRITNTIGISVVAVDFRARIAIVGEGGRRGACIQQTAAKPVFQLKNTVNNLRDFEMRNLQLYGGTVGIELQRANYNLFDDVVISNQSLHGISTELSFGNQFRSIWMVNQFGNNALVKSGGLWFTDSQFGESVGGFDVTGGSLILDNSSISDARNRLQTAGVAGEGNALFRVKGGNLMIHGGTIQPGAVDTLIYSDYPRDILIEGTDLQLGTVSNLVANRYAHSGDKPYPVLVVRASRVSSYNNSGLNLYNQLATGSGSTVHAHSDAVYDIGATEYRTTAPFFDVEFTDASKRNTTSIRARPNQEVTSP